jgi:hypothetical protein
MYDHGMPGVATVALEALVNHKKTLLHFDQRVSTN